MRGWSASILPVPSGSRSASGESLCAGLAVPRSPTPDRCFVPVWHQDLVEALEVDHCDVVVLIAETKLTTTSRSASEGHHEHSAVSQNRVDPCVDDFASDDLESGLFQDLTYHAFLGSLIVLQPSPGKFPLIPLVVEQHDSTVDDDDSLDGHWPRAGTHGSPPAERGLRSDIGRSWQNSSRHAGQHHRTAPMAPPMRALGITEENQVELLRGIGTYAIGQVLKNVRGVGRLVRLSAVTVDA